MIRPGNLFRSDSHANNRQHIRNTSLNTEWITTISVEASFNKIG